MTISMLELEMIEATEVSFTEIIIFGDRFGKVTLTNCDDLIFNKSCWNDWAL